MPCGISETVHASLPAQAAALSAQVAFFARDYDTAERFARQAIAIDPEFWVGHMQPAQALAETGATDAAFDSLDKRNGRPAETAKCSACAGICLGGLAAWMGLGKC